HIQGIHGDEFDFDIALSRTLLGQVGEYRDFSSSLAFDSTKSTRDCLRPARGIPPALASARLVVSVATIALSHAGRRSDMAEVLLFHHALGRTPGVLAFADLLRTQGHTVHTPDLYDGR